MHLHIPARRNLGGAQQYQQHQQHCPSAISSSCHTFIALYFYYLLS
jgi:hypothetical protein